MTVIVSFNVRGEIFHFAKSTLVQPHLKGSVLERRVSDEWKGDDVPFLCVDPVIFRKYCIPYIGHGLLPTSSKLESKRDVARHLHSVANSIGLIDLANHVYDTFLKAKAPPAETLPEPIKPPATRFGGGGRKILRDNLTGFYVPPATKFIGPH